MLKLHEAKNGTEIDELLQARASGHKMFERIQVLEDGRVPAKEGKIGKLNDKKEESREKSIRGFCISLKWKVSWRKKDCGILLEKRCCRTEEGLPKEESDVMREYKAMRVENFLSSWLREDGKHKEERVMEVDKETKEETGNNKRTEEEKDENETVCAKRRCVWVLFLRRPLIF